MTIRIDGTNTTANPGITGTDTDTGLQFGTDEVSIVTGGEEQVKVDSNGRLGVGNDLTNAYDTTYNQLCIGDGTGNNGMLFHAATNGGSYIGFKDTTDGSVNGLFNYIHNGDYFELRPGGTTRARVDSDGLKFNADTAAVNALNDYEEGTWTPVFQCSSTPFTSVTHTIQSGNYTKIGNLVHVACRIRSTASSGGGGALLIGGLPYQVNCNTGSGGGAPSFYLINVLDNSVVVTTEARNNTNQFYLLASTDAGTWANVLYDGISGNGMSELRVAFAYQTNS